MGRDWKSYAAAPLAAWERVRALEEELRRLTNEVIRGRGELQSLGADVSVFDRDDVIVLPPPTPTLAAEVQELERQVVLARTRAARLERVLAEAREAMYDQQGQSLGWRDF